MACRIIIPTIGPNKGKEIQSILFRDLMSLFSNAKRADEIYKKIFSDEFLDNYGDWMDLAMNKQSLEEAEVLYGVKRENLKLDENGEPTLESLEFGGIMDVKGAFEEYASKTQEGKRLDLLDKQVKWNQKVSDAQEISEEGALKIVEKLERAFGFKAKVINRKDKKWAGKFVADVPVINTAYMRKDTAFHEFAHPWVNAIFVKNIRLFNSLKNELLATEQGRAILKKVKERYPELGGNEFFKEAIVTAIGEYAAGMIDKKGNRLTTLIFELLQRIGELIKRIYNPKATIKPEDLGGQTLQQLAMIMAEGDAKIETSITEFMSSPNRVTKENFLKRLQGEGIVTPGQVQGYYGIVDTLPGEVRVNQEVLDKNIAIVDRYAEDFPGLIRRVGNDVVFDFTVPVEDFTANAQYQVVENEEVGDAPTFEKIVEEDTIAILEAVRDREKVRLSEDESEYKGRSGIFQRLTHFVKVGILGQDSDTVNSEYAARRRFERNKKNIETDTLTIEGTEHTYEDLVNIYQKRSNNSTARGRATHKIMEFTVTKDKNLLAELKEEQKEKPDQDEITDQSLQWVWNVAEGVLRRIGIKSTDKMKAELMLHSPILGIGTQIDGLIQHEDGTLTMVDWKSGGHFLNDRTTTNMMRYSNGTLDDVPDSKLSKAMLELAVRAIMIKEHQPNAKFKQIIIQHLDRNNPFKSPYEVHLKDYITIIGSYLQVEKPEVYAALKEKGLLDADSYISHKVRNSSVLAKFNDKPINEQIAGLEKEIEIIRTRIKTPGMSRDLAADQELHEVLSNAYLELTKTSKETLDSEKTLGNLKTWASSIYNIASPRIQAFNKIFRRASNNYQQRMEDERQTAELLFKDVRDEYLRDNPASRAVGLVTLGQLTGFSYKDIFSFAFEDKLDEVQTEGVYLVSLEDAQTKRAAGEITAAQFALLEHLHKRWNTEWDSLMEKKMESGNPYSKTIGLHDVENAVIDGKLHKNFMPRLPMETGESYERYKGDGIIARKIKGTGSVIKMFAAKTFSMFVEENYYGESDTMATHIPVKFMGSPGIIADELHSFNLEKMHYDFIGNLMRKQEMDFVVALGDGIKSYYNNMKRLKGDDDKGWDNYEKFMENFIVNAVMQQRPPGRRDHWSSKQHTITNYFFNPKKPVSLTNKKTFQISAFKIMMAMKHFTTGKSMFFKLFAGTFNGAIILMYTIMRGVQGTVSKRVLGGDPGAIDMTSSDLIWGAGHVANYYKDQILNTFTKKPSNNKLHNLMRRFNYLPDNYDYAVNKSDMMVMKNPLLSYDKLFFFHAIHEEWGHALMLAAQMRRIKMPDGSSIWDSYDNDGNFIKVKDGKRNIRGVITDPSGQKRVIDELTEDEINRMLKTSTDTHGAYRKHERTLMESTALGVWALQFKKYLPALLIQEWETRKDDVNLGKYEAMTDERGNKIQEPVEMEIDGKKQMVTMNTMEWISWQHEGRARVLLKTIVGTTMGGQYSNYAWSELNDRDKYDIVGVASKYMMFFLMGLALSAGYDDDEEDMIYKRLVYLRKDALQGLDAQELLRTVKNPFAVITHLNSLIEATSVESMRKDIPFLAIGYEMERYGLIER